MAKKLVQFDWALKKLLRHKANFGILAGFLSELLGFDVVVEQILESEGNKQAVDDKFNRVDILIRAQQGELMLVELQNDPEVDYFQRMLYGVSKLITEYIREGEAYEQVRKVFSINIVYFDLGQGSDYVYAYEGQFVGRRQRDVLRPTAYQQKRFGIEGVADIFPKYYLLKVNQFDDLAKDTLDEWIYFFKNSEVEEGFTAKGMDEVREKLARERLSEEERQAYERYLEDRRVEKSVLMTAELEGRREGVRQTALNMLRMGLDQAVIARATGLSEAELARLAGEEGS
jgi:hypothetical protein